MHLYSRPQLWVLLAITAFGGFGLAVGAWRRAHPELATRLERLDAAPAAAGSSAPRTPRGAVPTARQTARPASVLRPWDRRASPRLSVERRAMERIGRADKRRPSDGPLDLNRATLEDLERLPGIGPGLARRIVAARQRSGPFASVDDLESVPGVGVVKLARFRDLVTVSP